MSQKEKGHPVHTRFQRLSPMDGKTLVEGVAQETHRRRKQLKRSIHASSSELVTSSTAVKLKGP